MTSNKPQSNKLLLFKVFSVLLPVIILAILEAALRLCGYGHNTDLFVSYEKDDRFWQINRYASEKFFSDTINATRGSSEIFAVNKLPNTVRIFVLGESTTVGYPYFHNGAFYRWLQFRLMRMYPDKNFEVVNLSMTALNSYAVLNFGKQLSRYKPDAVLMYTGHNEYYGAMGIGSTSAMGSNPVIVKTLIKMRELRVVQLLNNFIDRVKLLSGKRIDTRDNLMKRMAARQEIAFGSKDYRDGIEQFSRNTNEICQFFNHEHIPVFLSTVVSNEKDLSPFISDKRAPVSAILSFNSGRKAYEAGNYPLAKACFDKAKDFDELRFRAPEAINMAIRKIASKYPVVHLVDVKKMFEEYSPHSIIGNELVLEHVHPNLEGYAIMSDAFFQALQQQHIIPGVPQKEMSLAELRQEMPLTQMDSLSGQYQIMFLKVGWPFNKPHPPTFMHTGNLEDTLAVRVALGKMQWKDAMNSIYDRALQTNNKAAQCRIIEAMALEYPQNKQFCSLAASLNTALQRYDIAALYYKKLNLLDPGNRLAARIIKLYLRAGKVERALTAVSDLPPAQQQHVKYILTRIDIAKQILETYKDNKGITDTLFSYYHKLGIPDSLITDIMK